MSFFLNKSFCRYSNEVTHFLYISAWLVKNHIKYGIFGKEFYYSRAGILRKNTTSLTQIYNRPLAIQLSKKDFGFSGILSHTKKMLLVCVFTTFCFRPGKKKHSPIFSNLPSGLQLVFFFFQFQLEVQ